MIGRRCSMPRRRGFFAAAAVAVTLLALCAGTARAATITIVNSDAAGEGFNDPTPVAPVTGNPGTTLGQQRLNVFAAAAAYWANRLTSNVAVQVVARFDPLTCTPTSAILGQAGMTEVYRDFPTAPKISTWYPVALTSALESTDANPTLHDIAATFNSTLDSSLSCLGGIGWFYAIGVATPLGEISLYETVRHEIAHGLGFATVTNGTTGARLQGFDDVYMTFLEDHSTGKTWPQMTNGERANSAKDPTDLHWIGANVVAAGAPIVAGRHPSGHVQMYAPATFSGGSSVSHWDTALVPDEMMEPIATLNPSDIVTAALLKDIGWPSAQAGGCVRDADTACLLGNRFEVEVDYQTAAQSGTAQVMSFNGQRAENGESAFFTFFSATNFEMGVKVLDACVFGKYWVFVSGLTDQGWTVTVRDTESAAAPKVYTNPIGTLSTTFADTNAFNCP